jgi:predicted RNase H-like nuclease (RuvC/YqgF family)
MLTGCSYTRIKPCCRFKSGYGSIEHIKKLELRNEKIVNVMKVQTTNYIILLNKKDAINKLKRKLSDTISAKDLINAGDTLDVVELSCVTNFDLTKAIIKQINNGKAIVIEKKTGLRVMQIYRRKYNYQNGPKNGRGGVDFKDLRNNTVIISLTYWYS